MENEIPDPETDATRALIERTCKAEVAMTLFGTVTHSLNHKLHELSSKCSSLQSAPHVRESKHLHSELASLATTIQETHEILHRYTEYVREQRRAKTPFAVVRDCVDSVSGTLYAATSARRCRVRLNCSHGLSVELPPEYLETILCNALLNSLDANARSVVISAKACDSDPDVVGIEISDNGSGMDSKMIPKAFDIGFTQKQTAAGLGLPLARQLAVRHGGSIELVSQPGGPTTLTVHLPRHHETG